MKVLDPGHMYRLDILDGDTLDSGGPETLTFVKREGENFPGNVGAYPGTTSQEVIRALINRSHHVDDQKRSPHNTRILHLYREILWELEERAAEVKGLHEQLPWTTTLEPEYIPVCSHCHHWVCDQFVAKES